MSGRSPRPLTLRLSTTNRAPGSYQPYLYDRPKRHESLRKRLRVDFQRHESYFRRLPEDFSGLQLDFLRLQLDFSSLELYFLRFQLDF